MGVHHLDARLGALRRTIAAARRTAWYGELLADLSVEEVSALEVVPLTRTEDLKVRAHTDFLAVDRSEVFHYHQSFGTTGKPSCGWYSLPDLEAEVPIISNWLRDFGPGAVILNRYPYSFPVPNALVETAARLLGGCVIPAGAANFNVSFVRTVHLLRDQKVTVVASLPWEPFFLAETARLLGLDPARDFPHLEGWIVAGSLVPPRMRALIEELWGCKVRILYGSTEAGPLATSCAEGLMHLHDDDFVFEVIDEELVLTTLRREAQPMVRYATGDAVRLTGGSCPCGHRGRVVELLGRAGGQVELGGRSWSDFDYQHTVLEHIAPFRSGVWFSIATRRGLLVRVETREDRSPRWAIQRALTEALGCRVRLRLHSPGALINHVALLSGWNMYKPRVLSDWRRPDERRIINWSGAVVDWWGQLDLLLLLRAVRKSVADRLLSWKLRLLG